LDFIVISFWLSWFLLALIVGVAANARGRNGLGWFTVAVILSPLIGGLLLLALPKKTPDVEISHAQTPFEACARAFHTRWSMEVLFMR
jgi:hypothetical protein